GLLYSAQDAPSGFDTSMFIDIKRTGRNPVVPLARKIAAGVERYLKHRDIAEFVRRCNVSADPKDDPYDPIVYQSMEYGECLNDLFSIARNMGPEGNTAGGRRPLPCLLINGPSGTGKSALARLIHASSARRDGPIKKLSSAVLVHSELLKS